MGVYGLFIDLVDIPEVFLSACEHMVLSKLFSVVVKDEEVGQKLIDLNKELKGGKINIFPLSWVIELADNDKRSYPRDEDLAILESVIKPKRNF